MADNKQAYSTEKVVNIYTTNFKLITAEDVLVRKYKSELQNASFLDIGIGGGRTTHFIAPIVKTYYGVDYSTMFVNHVAEEYKDNKKVVIEFGDARELGQYADASFEFVLFSFNGIDCVGFEDRKRIIKECFRLLKPKGHFWFSFHNINSLPKLYSFQWPKNPLNWFKELKRSKTVKEINGDIKKYQNRDYCILRDGADFFETEVMYLQPAIQEQLLTLAGFSDVQFYHAQNGTPLNKTEANNKNIDWIYIDCIKP
jgi:ubiquinone/menaquinone biosynthesis C-methylase UbiE